MANIRISELDFDEIKRNLKTFLQAQSEFTDYDFEGSGLSVLLDLLAYNTHYNAYMANMLVNEMFLDSAVKRESAVSLAKHLGYTSRSARCSTATVNVQVNNPTGLPATLTMDEYTPFTTTVDGTQYTFITQEAHTITPSNGLYVFNNIKVYEGQQLSFVYTVESVGPDKKYVIPNDNVDTTTLKVVVQNSSVDTTSSVYTLSTNPTVLDGTSKVYFVEENPAGKYEIYFGDGVLGKQLSVGNIITIEYTITSGDALNVSSTITQNFSLSGTIDGNGNVDVTTVTNSTGGALKEDITSIKFNAPKFGEAQNRAVTSGDYEALIKSNFSEAEAVSVWGGETNDPPIYGKVIISLKPYSGYFISSTSKDQIKNLILQNRKVLTIQPEFVDPDYFHVGLVLNVNYNPHLTTLSAGQLESDLIDVVDTYFNQNYNQFNKKFYLSALVTYLMGFNPSLLSIVAIPSIQKRIVPVLGTTNVYSGATAIRFYNKIHPTELTSTRFYINLAGTQTLVALADVPNQVPMDYEGTGTVWIVNADTGAQIQAVGTVYYSTGVVDLIGLPISGYPEGQYNLQIKVELQEFSYNIETNRGQVIVLNDNVPNALVGTQAGVVVNMRAATQ